MIDKLRKKYPELLIEVHEDEEDYIKITMAHGIEIPLKHLDNLEEMTIMNTFLGTLEEKIKLMKEKKWK